MEDSSPRIKNFLDVRGYDVFNQVSSTINQAVIHNRDKVVMLVHPNAGNVILINRNEFEEVYDIALEWFLKKEYYEMCSTISSWKKNLIKKKQTPKENIKTLI